MMGCIFTTYLAGLGGIDFDSASEWSYRAPLASLLNEFVSEQRLYINERQYFDCVSETIWNFKIGGYQVLDKYLKSRKNRALELEEINTIRDIINVLAFTDEKMREIDDYVSF